MSESEAANFLQSIRPNEPWVLVAITLDGPTETITARSPAEVDAFVSANNGKRNLYYQVNPTKTAMTKKPAKADIAAVEYLFTDLDPEDNETTDAAKARYRKRIATFEQTPTAIVDSGNGIQALWKLSTRIELNGSPEQIADIESRTKALTLRLGGKAGTQNIDRLLRLPGTTNLPNAKKRKAGRVECQTGFIEFNNLAHPLEAFAREPEQQREKSKQGDGGKQKLPRELTNMLYLSGKEPANFKSRSELLYAFLHAALRRGIDENEIIAACIDPSFKGYSIFDHVEENGGRDYVKRQIEHAINDARATTTDDGKAIIYVAPGGRFKAWREVEHAILRNPKCQVFVRGPRLVEPLWRFEQDDDGGEVLACQFVRYNMLRLSDVVARHAAVFVKFTPTGNQRPIDPPADVIETLLVRQDWQFPTVVGIVNTPTMRPDASLLTQPGYDRQTRLWYKSSGEVKLPPFPERPTKEDAQGALELLKGVLKGFPFDGQVSLSVALAAMFTTALRGVLRIAPIFAVIAPDPRTGKTFLVNLLCVLATGHRPVPSAGSRDSKELEKRIETAALSGRAVMHLNNLQNGMVVESERLSELCTEGQVYIRTLGRHGEGLCDCRGTTIFLNGNNIVMAADLVPRTAVCRLDAKMENPGGRAFEFDPIELVRRDRGKYLAAIFTIVRAFMADGSPEQEGMTRVAGFETWSRFVQQPLMWLGEADPLGGMEDARALDPSIEELRQLIEVLRKCFPAAQQFFTVADCARLAEEMDHDSWGRPRYKRQDLRDVMTFQNKINTRSFGWLLKRHRDRVIDGWSIRVAGGKERKDANTYYLDGPTRQAPAQEDEEIM